MTTPEPNAPEQDWTVFAPPRAVPPGWPSSEVMLHPTLVEAWWMLASDLYAMLEDADLHSPRAARLRTVADYLYGDGSWLVTVPASETDDPADGEGKAVTPDPPESSSCEDFQCDGHGVSVQGWTDKNGYPEDQRGPCGHPCRRTHASIGVAVPGTEENTRD